MGGIKKNPVGKTSSNLEKLKAIAKPMSEEEEAFWRDWTANKARICEKAIRELGGKGLGLRNIAGAGHAEA